MVDVETARRKLLEALGRNSEKYLCIVKQWYRQKFTKDEFDTLALELLGPGKISYHNQFILAILAKCQSVAVNQPSISTAKHVSRASSRTIHAQKPRVKRPDTGATRTAFERCDTLDSAPSLAAKDLVLPDIPTLHGRLFLGAWDVGLESIADDTASLLLAAVESQLKNILTICLLRRKNSLMRSGNHFRYRFGVCQVTTELNDQTLCAKSAKRPRTCDQAEAELYTETAASNRNSLRILPPVSLFDLRDCIQTYTHVIPSHTVRASCTQRVLSQLWHPGNDEIAQNKLYMRENKKLRERLKHQRNLRV